MSPKQKSARRAAANNKPSKGFSADERAAMRARAQELKAEALKADGEKTWLERRRRAED